MFELYPFLISAKEPQCNFTSIALRFIARKFDCVFVWLKIHGGARVLYLQIFGIAFAMRTYSAAFTRREEHLLVRGERVWLLYFMLLCYSLIPY